MTLTLNSQSRELPDLAEGAPLADLVATLGLLADRIAIEVNGQIAPRDTWPQVALHSGDRLELVHFVGGGRS